MDRAEAGQLGLRARTVRPMLSWQEAKLLDRFAQSLVRGEYRSAREAAEACSQELARLHAKHRGEVWAAFPRSLIGVRSQVHVRAKALGGQWSACRRLTVETHLARRYAQAFLHGRFRSVKAAARACHEELHRLRLRYAGSTWFSFHRPFNGVYDHVRSCLHELGWSNPSGCWSQREKRVLAAFARRVVSGRYRSATEAARAAMSELARLRRKHPSASWLARRRTFLAVWRVIADEARAMGGFGTLPDWSPGEVRLLDRSARRVIAGRCPTAQQAGRDFMREVERLRLGPRPPGWLSVRRSPRAVQTKANERCRALGRPKTHLRWTPAEEHVLNRCARALAEGRFRSRAHATRVCGEELERLGRALPQGVHTRTYQAVLGAIRKKTDALGSDSPRKWSAAEKRLVDHWARWCMRSRDRGNFWALSEAAAGLRKDLAVAGAQRSHVACSHQVMRGRFRLRERQPRG